MTGSFMAEETITHSWSWLCTVNCRAQRDLMRQVTLYLKFMIWYASLTMRLNYCPFDQPIGRGVMAH